MTGGAQRRRPVVAIVGAGGIGQPCALALADEGAALLLIDDDRVDASNLHRLPAAREADVGALKTDVALRALRARGREGDRGVEARVLPETARALLAGADLVVDACDNFATRFLVADACGLLGVPVVHGAATGWIGTVFTTVPGASACYRCVFEDVPAGDALDCATGGVYGPVTAVIGALMAADARALLRGDRARAGVFGSYDALGATFREVALARRADCALCGTGAILDLDPRRYSPAACAAVA